MFSPVTYPTPSPPPKPSPSVREMAAAGYFRAIALWLNEPLASQGIFVRVQGDRPGCLKLTVEFERPPLKERLLRFLCHRLWVLNSELIEGIYVVARPVGRRRVAWAKRIRIATPAVKRRRATVRVAHPARHNSPLPPQIRQQVAHLSTQNLKTLRSLLLAGSAVAAFVFGCLVEVLASGTSPMLPSFSARSTQPAAAERVDRGESGNADLAADLQATTIHYRSAEAGNASDAVASDAAVGADSKRSTVVDAALEHVGVIQHHLPEGIHSDDVTLMFGGDLSLESLAYDELAEAGGIFTEVEDYLEADLSMVTLGSPLASAATTLEEELYNRDRPEAVNLLAESGVDIVNLTNDSLMAHGAQGLEETLKTLDSKGLYRVGAGRNETEARRPEVIDVKGKRIAYLSYSMGGDSSAFEERAGTNAQEMKEIVEDIQALRDQVDWIVVNYRWMEFITEEPNFKQTNLARMAIDQGADVVVGYHPDVIQGAEVYKGRPIAYSVGDFVFEPENSIADQDSAMLKVSLKQDQMKVEFVPVRVQNARPKSLQGSEGEAMLKRIEEVSQQFEKPMKSSMVLDLKDKNPVVPEEYDPDSPFVSPEEAETLTIPAEEPAENTEAEPPPTASDADAPGGDTPDGDTPAPAPPPEKESEPENSAPHSADDKPTPAVVDMLQQLEDDLPQWGPKPSDGQQEFQPVPQQLRDAEQNQGDVQTSPGLLRLMQEPHQDSQDSARAVEAPDSQPNSLRTEPAPQSLVAQTTPDRNASAEAEVSGNPSEPADAQVEPQGATAEPEPVVEDLLSSLKPAKTGKAAAKHPLQPALVSQLSVDTDLENQPPEAVASSSLEGRGTP